jgi:hypothetical protein
VNVQNDYVNTKTVFAKGKTHERTGMELSQSKLLNVTSERIKEMKNFWT